MYPKICIYNITNSENLGSIGHQKCKKIMEQFLWMFFFFFNCQQGERSFVMVPIVWIIYQLCPVPLRFLFVVLFIATVYTLLRYVNLWFCLIREVENIEDNVHIQPPLRSFSFVMKYFRLNLLKWDTPGGKNKWKSGGRIWKLFQDYSVQCKCFLIFI